MEPRPREHQLPDAASASGAAASPPPAREPTHAERVRTLVHGERRGALSTVAADPAGYPFGSVVSFGLADDGDPLLFVSLMAEHTQNALRDPRASLLVTEPVPEGADPLASGRVTLLGLLTPIDDDGARDVARARYLEANPAASYYIDFGDFTFLRLTVDHVRYVGGYGRMSWVDAAEYRTATPDPLVDAAAGIIEHMNADHADAQVLFCRHFAGLADTESATMSAVDRYGFDLVAVSDAHRTAVRLAFPDECTTGDEVRRAMVAMVARRAPCRPDVGSQVPPGRTASAQRLEVLERVGLAVRVERDLVPLVGELRGEVVARLALVLVAGVRVLAEVGVVVLALEVLVDPDHLVHVVAHVRTDHLGGDAGWLNTLITLPMSWHSEANTTSGSAPAFSALVAVWRQWVSWSVAKPSVMSAHWRSIVRNCSATRGWLFIVSAPMTAHPRRWTRPCG